MSSSGKNNKMSILSISYETKECKNFDVSLWRYLIN